MWSSMVNRRKANNAINVVIAECSRCTLIHHYAERGYLLEVKRQIADMAVNGSGLRDTARVLQISPTRVIETLKKRPMTQTSQ